VVRHKNGAYWWKNYADVKHEENKRPLKWNCSRSLKYIAITKV
jgi:hypothetical protein